MGCGGSILAAHHTIKNLLYYVFKVLKSDLQHKAIMDVWNNLIKKEKLAEKREKLGKLSKNNGMKNAF